MCIRDRYQRRVRGQLATATGRSAAPRTPTMLVSLLYGLCAFWTCVLAMISTRVLSRVIHNRREQRRMDDAKVPLMGPTHWLFGSMLDFFVTHAEDRHDYMVRQMAAQKTKIARVDSILFDDSPSELIVSDPANVKYMLKDNVDNFIKTKPNGDETFYNFKRFLGDGIFAVSHGPHAIDGGDKWYMQRKITSKMFTAHEFKNFIFETFMEKADSLVTALKDKSGPVDLQEYFFKYTMDAFGAIAFRQEFGTIEGNTNAYGEAFDGAHSSFLRFTNANALIATCLKLLPMSSRIRQAAESILARTSVDLKEFDGHMRSLREYTSKTIADRRRSGDKSSRDILGMFLQASEEQDVPFSELFLSDVVLNLIIAGRDTTACMLSWTFYELGRNPEVLTKLRKGLEGSDPDDYEDMKKQPYLTAVFYEVNRLWPPVPVDGKVVAQDDILPDGTPVGAGVKVAYSAYVMGRDPDLWPNPEEFRPERWLEQGEFRAPSQFMYPVFQAGPRVCLGMNFALMEASVVTTKLLQNYDFKLASQERRIPDTGKLTMTGRGPLNVHVKARAEM
eukprot:TRINITY_DN2769_c0_g1_i1.p1 TRINITY_DN2769_c0_g1~~TRINITY_DN2769_c0_g1_i1.p1  ORF type:complete len:561 (+),score=125.12 TRINITY_DN2769_c0_g1_i1:138-1820(+)